MRPGLAVPAPLLDAIRAYRLAHHIKLRVIAESVLQLSEMFTGRRPMRPGYMARPALRAAYIYYYLPLHYLKVRRVMAELASYAGPARGPALDFGCGPGTAALAIGEGEIDLIDIVDEVFDDADFLIRAAAPAIRPRFIEGEPTRRYRLIVAANVLAELREPSALRRLLERSLEPDGHLVVVEPAMREPTRRLMRWRDELAAAGFRIAAPCLERERCPMLAREDMWCHQDVPWARPSFIDEIDRRTGLRKESLKYSYLVVTRSGPTLSDPLSPSAGSTPSGGEASEGKPAAQWRVVSDLHRAKGRTWAFLCGHGGPLCRCEMLTRHRDPARRDFERARRGDLLSVDPPVAGESARLGDDSIVRRTL